MSIRQVYKCKDGNMLIEAYEPLNNIIDGEYIAIKNKQKSKAGLVSLLLLLLILSTILSGCTLVPNTAPKSLVKIVSVAPVIRDYCSGVMVTKRVGVTAGHCSELLRFGARALTLTGAGYRIGGYCVMNGTDIAFFTTDKNVPLLYEPVLSTEIQYYYPVFSYGHGVFSIPTAGKVAFFEKDTEVTELKDGKLVAIDYSLFNINATGEHSLQLNSIGDSGGPLIQNDSIIGIVVGVMINNPVLLGGTEMVVVPVSFFIDNLNQYISEGTCN